VRESLARPKSCTAACADLQGVDVAAHAVVALEAEAAEAGTERRRQVSVERALGERAPNNNNNNNNNNNKATTATKTTSIEEQLAFACCHP
jgi:hypothetical protein